jgi:hypothetical protein
MQSTSFYHLVRIRVFTVCIPYRRQLFSNLAIATDILFFSGFFFGFESKGTLGSIAHTMGGNDNPVPAVVIKREQSPRNGHHEASNTAVLSKGYRWTDFLPLTLAMVSKQSRTTGKKVLKRVFRRRFSKRIIWLLPKWRFGNFDEVSFSSISNSDIDIESIWSDDRSDESALTFNY